MESKIPLPTDNIYKFYALFGLLLLVFSIGATLYVNKTSNEQLVALFVELESLKQEKAPSPPQQLRRAIVDRLIEVGRSDKEFFRWALGLVAGIGVVGLAYGFNKWHMKVQPICDETTRVQLEIAKLQLAKLQAESTKPDA